MAITLATTWDWNDGTTTALTTGFFTPTNNNLIVVGIAVGAGGTVTSVVDSLSNTYTLRPAYTPSTGGRTGYLAYLPASNATSRSITANITPSTAASIGALSFTGIALTSPFDTDISAIGLGTAQDSGPSAVTQFNNELLIGLGWNNTGSAVTWTAGGSFTNTGASSGVFGSIVSMILEYQIVSSTGSYNATATSNVSSNWGQAIATFADTPVSPATSASVAWITA